MTNSVENDFNEIEERNGWQNEFMLLKDRSDVEARDKQFTLEQAKINRKYNRYRDVFPYDHSRIILNRLANMDYINANLVKCERANRRYILTQGPLEQTVSHFWLMVWEQDTKAILMLNKIVEKKQIKCHKYWPENIGEKYILDLPDVGLQVEYLRCEEFENFCIRTLRLTDVAAKPSVSREIYQFHYTTWPDFGIPSSPLAFLQFLKKVRDSGAMSDNVGPPVVHCSAGIGRSGTFCLVDCCLILVNKFGEQKISVKDVLHELRSHRMGLIQTTDQLYFSYQAIIEGIKVFSDPKWCEARVESVIKLTETTEDECMDETPPPLPPPRIDSLQQQQQQEIPAKPLPMIPSSETFAEEHEGKNDHLFSKPDVMQPLPQIPMEADENSESDSSVSAVESYDDSPEDDEREEEESLEQQTPMDSNRLDNDSYKEGKIQNGLKPDNTEETTVRKRVQREEKQSVMADRVKEIKRKQREVEESVSSKKRRSLIVKITLTAVLIGFVCIYTYSRK